MVRKHLITAIVTTMCLATAVAAQQDEERTLKAGEEGTTLRSMTVEGEDRVRVEFNRPKLNIDIDPASAPGLDWDVVTTLLGSDILGLYAPLVDRSRWIRSEYRPRPWLQEFRRGDIARFRPALERVEEWSLVVANSRGEEVFRVSGDGRPPKEIGWDGLRTDKTHALPGLTYSFMVEAADKAGNRRNFAGSSFELPSYYVAKDKSRKMLFAATETSLGEYSPAILEAASHINQLSPSAPVTIVVNAADYATAKRVADETRRILAPQLLGLPSRIAVRTDVKPTAPQGGSVTISVEG